MPGQAPIKSGGTCDLANPNCITTCATPPGCSATTLNSANCPSQCTIPNPMVKQK